MAVTITTEGLINALRLDNNSAIASEITRLLGYSTELALRLAPDATDPAHNQAMVQMVGWLYERPSVSDLPRQYANAFRNSGAAEVLAPWRGGGSPPETGGMSGGVTPELLAMIESIRDSVNALMPTVAANERGLITANSEIGTLQTEIEGNRTGIASNLRVSSANLAALQMLDSRFADAADLQASTVGTDIKYFNIVTAHVAADTPLLMVIETDISNPSSSRFPAYDYNAGDVVYFPPGSADGEFLLSIAAGDADLSAYRTSAMQDIIDNRATAGILLARQEAETADEKAVAAQEDADDALASKQDTLTALGDVPGLTNALAAKQDTLTGIADVPGLSDALENAGGGAAAYADPQFVPNYWVANTEARRFTLYMDPRMVADTMRTANDRYTVRIAGVTVVSSVIQFDTPRRNVSVSESEARDIAAALGTIGSQTCPVTVHVQARDLDPNHLWTGFLPIVTSAPVGGDVDLSAYRTASDQDVIDGLKQDTLTGVGDVPGLQAALDAKQATPVPISDVTGLQAALDAVAPAAIADPVIEPGYWVDTNDARTLTVHFDAAALALAGASKVRLTVQGNVRTVNIAVNQHTYDFAFDATAATNVSNARSVGQTVRADTFVLDNNDAQLYHVIGLLRVVASEPSTGGGFNPVIVAARVPPGQTVRNAAITFPAWYILSGRLFYIAAAGASTVTGETITWAVGAVNNGSQFTTLTNVAKAA